MAATAEAYYGRLLTGAGEHTGTRPTSHGREINYQRLEDGVGGGCEWRDVSVAGGDVGECVCRGGGGAEGGVYHRAKPVWAL